MSPRIVTTTDGRLAAVCDRTGCGVGVIVPDEESLDAYWRHAALDEYHRIVEDDAVRASLERQNEHYREHPMNEGRGRP